MHDPLSEVDRDTLYNAGISNAVLVTVAARSGPQGVTFTIPDLTHPDSPFEIVMLSAARRAELQSAALAAGRLERTPKYMQMPGRGGALWCPVPRPDAGTVLIVEGTKGHLAAASWAGQDIEVIGINGCWGWSIGDGKAIPDPALERRVAGRRVVVLLDADVRTNPDVNMAGSALQTQLKAIGAGSVAFASFGTGKDSIDDVLATMPPGECTAFLDKLVADASPLKPMSAADRARINAHESARRAEVDLATRAKATEMPPIAAVDKDVAAAFTHVNAEGLRYDAVDGRWVTWNGQRWDRRAGGVLAQARFQHFVDNGPPVFEEKTVSGVPIKTRAVKWMGEHRRIGAVLGHAQSMAPLTVTDPAVWDANPYLMALPNGTLDLATLEFRPSRPADMMTTLAGTHYDPAATAPMWQDFIAWALPDEEVRRYLQRILGYSMLGVVRHHILPCLVGGGRNGKGTFIRVTSAVFGEYAGQANSRLIVAGRDPHDTDTGTVYGKRVAFFEETANGTRWDVNQLKSLTGGDDGKVRELYGAPKTVRAQHTLILGTNHRPNIPAGESAFWRRYREIPFTQTIVPGQERPIDIAMVERELPGVLNWILEGLGDYWAVAKTGLDPMAPPDAVVAAGAEARTQGSEFAAWLHDRYMVTGSEQDRVRVGDIWDRWDAHRRTENLLTTAPRASRMVAQAVIGEADGRVRKEYFSTKNVMYLVGIRQNAGTQANAPVSLGKPSPAQEENPQVNPAMTTQPTQATQAVGVVESVEREVKNDVMGGVFEAPIGRVSGSLGLASPNPPKTAPDLGPTQNQDLPRPEFSPVSEMSDSRTSSAPSGGPFATLDELDAIREGGMVALDLEGGDIADQWTTPAGHYLRLGGIESDAGYAVTADLGDLAQAVADAPLLAGFNLARFDGHHLARHAEAVGVPGPNILRLALAGRLYDGMVADQLFNPPPAHMKPERAMQMYSLEAVCERWGVPGKTDQLSVLAEKHGGYGAIPQADPDYLAYLRGDVAAHRALTLAQAPQVTPYVMREMAVAAIAGQMTAAGVKVNAELLEERRKSTANHKANLVARLAEDYDIAPLTKGGKPSKAPQSTDEGRKLIVERLVGLGVDARDIPRTGEGKPQVGTEPLRDLAQRYRYTHPNGEAIARLCAIVAGISSSRTVYQTAADHVHGDGRVHPEILTLQASGRWSVIKPGMTVFGKRGGRVVEREIFQAAEGYRLIAADLSQIDMRAVAAHSQDSEYIALFTSGRDIHAETALAVFGNADMRDEAKPCNHGWNYGQTPGGMHEHSGVPLELAHTFDRGMWENFPVLCAWREGVREHAKAGGLLDNGFGRIMRPDRSRAHTQGPALMGQGTARDLMMHVMLSLPEDIIRMLRIQVHDEIVLEVLEADVEEVSREVAKAMTFEWAPPHGSIPVPIVGEVSKPSVSWAGCYDK